MPRRPKPPTYTNLFDEHVPLHGFKEEEGDVNPMVKAQGPGPDAHKCKDCVFLIRKEYARTYYKCKFRGNTNGSATDHKVNWQSCSKFVLDLNDPEVVKRCEKRKLLPPIK